MTESLEFLEFWVQRTPSTWKTLRHLAIIYQLSIANSANRTNSENSEKREAKFIVFGKRENLIGFKQALRTRFNYGFNPDYDVGQ